MRTTLALLAAFALGALTAAVAGAHADQQPAFDRAMATRIVRAQEAQAHALEDIARAMERCKR